MAETREVRPLDVHDDAALHEWYATFHGGLIADVPDRIVTSYTALATSLRSPKPSRVRQPIGAYAPDGTLVGALLFEYDLEHDLDLVEAEISVLSAVRGRGHGAALWTWVEQAMSDLGRTRTAVELDVPPTAPLEESAGGRFALTRGFRSEHVEHRLTMPWPGNRPPLNSTDDDIRTWVGPTPEDLLEPMAQLRSVMEADVPIGNLTRDQRSWTPERVRESSERTNRSYRTYSALATAPDGTPSGYTIAFVDRGTGDAIQDDTLVARDHRGRGLGAQLKAANYAVMEQHEPDLTHVHTWTDPDNTPMLRVNEQFGFAVASVLHEMERDAP